MAKYGVTNVAGGGGIGSDELSVTKDYVLNGKTYVGTDTNEEIGTGTMANNGTTANQSLNAGGSFQVKKGYHAQDFSVNANSLASQTSATATSGHILSGQSAWVNGNKVTGTMPDKTKVDSLIGGMNPAYPNVAVHKGAAPQMTNTTASKERLFAMSPPSGYYLQGTSYVACNQSDVASVAGVNASNIRSGTSILGVTGNLVDYSYLAQGQTSF